MRLTGVLLLCVTAGCQRQEQTTWPKLLEQAHQKLEAGDVPGALALARQGHKDHDSDPERSWRFRVLEAEALTQQRKSAEAIELLAPPLPAALETTETAVRRGMTKGFAEALMGDYEIAERDLDQAEKARAALNLGDLAAPIALRRGGLNLLRHRSAAAEADFLRALGMARENHNTSLEMDALGNLGALQMRTFHYAQAIDWATQSAELARKTGARTRLEKNLGNLGWCYYKMGDTEAALPKFLEAERLCAQAGLDGDRKTWVTNIGAIYQDRADYPAALHYYAEALKIAERLRNPAEIAASLNNLASAHLDAGNYEEASRYNAQALMLKRDSEDPGSRLASAFTDARIEAGRKNFARAEQELMRVISGTSDDLSQRWQAQAELGRVLLAQNRPAHAGRAFREAVNTIDRARTDLGRDEHKLSFRSSVNSYYDEYVDFLMQHNRPGEALAVAEFSRARVLKDKLGLEGITRAAPMAQSARVGAVILSFWLSASRSYLWVVTPREVVSFTLPGEAAIQQLVEAYQKALAGARNVRESGNADGLTLYTTLIAPAARLLPAGSRVMIIPDGSLHHLNFETLLVPGKPLPHYWIEDAIISTATSMALLRDPRTGKAQGRRTLLIGDPVSPGKEFPPLPHAAAEVQLIRKGTEASVYQGPQATAAAYRGAQPGQFEWIHFAAHGTASIESPLDSAVVLTSGKLYAREIATLPLRAELVTISACYSSGARMYSGEGLVGLAWSFLLAGAHNVIAALWEVNDSYTPQLMSALYEHLAQGEDAAYALRAAKLSLLHSDYVCRNPRYWGPFQLYTGY